MDTPNDGGAARHARSAMSTFAEDVMVDDESSHDHSAGQHDSPEHNGDHRNGTGLNGSGLNGTDLNGTGSHRSGHESLHLLVHEEYLEPIVREEKRRIEVRKTIHTEPAEVSIMATTEHAKVERHRVDREVESVPEPYWVGDTYIIPVVEEELVVTRRLVVREEVHITRTSGSEEIVIPGTVRREVIDITGPVDVDETETSSAPVAGEPTVGSGDVLRGAGISGATDHPHRAESDSLVDHGLVDSASEQSDSLARSTVDWGISDNFYSGSTASHGAGAVWGTEGEVNGVTVGMSGSDSTGGTIDEAVADDEDSAPQRGRHRRN